MTYTVEGRKLRTQYTAVCIRTSDEPELDAWLPEAFAAARVYLERKGAGPNGTPYTREVNGELEAGYPATTPINGEDDIEGSDLPSGLVAVAVLDGDGTDVDDAVAALNAWVADQGGTVSGPPWEVFGSENPADAREVVLPYKLP